MHIFFGDDSIRPGKRGGMGILVGFGGVLFHHAKLGAFQKAVRGIRKDFRIPSGVELKWSPSRKSWLRDHLIEERRLDCYTKILSEVRAAEGTAFVVCFDRGRKPVTPTTALSRCMTWCFERVSMCLDDRETYGLIICDRPGGGQKENDSMLGSFLFTVEWGTDFVPPGRVPLNILTTPSHLVHELQVADLITGITTAMVAGDTKWAEPLFELIRPAFHKNSLGYVGGAGLKLYPDTLWNLHYWVGKEDSYTKPAMMGGWGLPFPDWPYALDGMNDSTAKATG
jgi:hypothetical protein